MQECEIVWTTCRQDRQKDLFMSQPSNLKLLTRKTNNNSLIQQPNWLELVLHGEQNQGAQQMKYVGNTFVF